MDADEEDGGGEGLDVEAQEALDVLPVEVIAALQRQARYRPGPPLRHILSKGFAT